jgi:hypothetical protein
VRSKSQVNNRVEWVWASVRILTERAGWSPQAQFVNQTLVSDRLIAQAVDGSQRRPSLAHRYEDVVDTFV